MGRTACTDPQCLYSRAIPLLPLWAVRPVQILSACTVELYLYSPYGPYGLYRVSVQGRTLPWILSGVFSTYTCCSLITSFGTSVCRRPSFIRRKTFLFIVYDHYGFNIRLYPFIIITFLLHHQFSLFLKITWIPFDIQGYSKWLSGF
jgi:hypothetical protein